MRWRHLEAHALVPWNIDAVAGESFIMQYEIPLNYLTASLPPLLSRAGERRACGAAAACLLKCASLLSRRRAPARRTGSCLDAKHKRHESSRGNQGFKYLIRGGRGGSGEKLEK